MSIDHSSFDVGSRLSPDLPSAGAPDASVRCLSTAPSAPEAPAQGSLCGASRCPLLHWIACGLTRTLKGSTMGRGLGKILTG